MGRSSSITPEQGERLLEAFKRLGNKSAACREIGVSEDAGMRYLASAPKAATPTLASQQTVIAAAGASLFDARAVLQLSWQRIEKLISQLESGIVLQRQGDDGELYETMVSPAILIAAIKEGREHIQAAMKLYELMIRVEEVQKFQQAILQVIGEIDEPTRRKIIAKLHELRAAGLALLGP